MIMAAKKGRFRLNRVGHLARMAASDLTNGKSDEPEPVKGGGQTGLDNTG